MKKKNIEDEWQSKILDEDVSFFIAKTKHGYRVSSWRLGDELPTFKDYVARPTREDHETSFREHLRLKRAKVITAEDEDLILGKTGRTSN